MSTGLPPSPPGFEREVPQPEPDPPAPGPGVHAGPVVVVPTPAPAPAPAASGPEPVEIRITIPGGLAGRLIWALLGLSVGGATATGLVSFSTGPSEDQVRELVAEELVEVLDGYALERKETSHGETSSTP